MPLRMILISSLKSTSKALRLRWRSCEVSVRLKEKAAEPSLSVRPFHLLPYLELAEPLILRISSKEAPAVSRAT